METKTKKTTMIGAALAVAIIALAGAGYAAVTYTATSSSNVNNDLTAAYVELSQSGVARYNNASFLHEVCFDTVDNQTSSTGFSYDVVCDYKDNTTGFAKDSTTTADCALVGWDLTLHYKNVGPAPSGVELVVEASDDFHAAGLTYVMVIGTFDDSTKAVTVTDRATLDSNNKWTFNNLTLGDGTDVPYEADWNLFLFVSGSVSSTPNTGFASSDVVFTFTLTANPPTNP